MKLRLLPFLALAALSACADDFVIAERGKSADCKIVALTSLGETERYAEKELREYVERLTGVKLGAAGARQITIKRDDSLYGTDGFNIKVTGSTLSITGGKRGVIYGVYEILETYGGVGWFSPNRTVVPQAARFAVPDSLDDTQRPAFEMREPFWTLISEYPEHATHLRTNGHWTNFPESMGGNDYRFGGNLNLAHTFQFLVPVEKYAKTHPEYYALRGGARQLQSNMTAQLCLSNEEVLKIVIDGVLETIARDPDAKFYGVSQNDNDNYCECERCAAVDEEEGATSGTLIRFVNKVAAAVEKVHPDKYIQTLAYQYSRHPAKKTMALPNVVPCLCSIECDFAHPLATSVNPNNASFRSDITGWNAQTDRLFIWDYTTSFDHYPSIFPNFDSLQSNIKFFKENGAIAVFEQGAYSHTRGAEFEALKPWLMAKWLWNPDADEGSLLDKFFPGYYGEKAAPFVRQYFDELRSLERKDGEFSIRCVNAESKRDVIQAANMASPEFLKHARELWSKAIAAAKTEEDRACWTNTVLGSLSVDYTRYLQFANSCAITPGVMVRRVDPAEDPNLAEYNEIVKRINAMLILEPNIRFRENSSNRRIVEELAVANDYATGKVAFKPSDVAALEEDAFTWWPGNGWCRQVEGEEFGGGKAMEVCGTSHEWCMQMFVNGGSFDKGAEYRLKAKVKVIKRENADENAEALAMGVYDLVTRTGAGHWRKQSREVKNGEWEWLDMGTWKATGNKCNIWVQCGVFDKSLGRNPAVDRFYLDRIVISRVSGDGETDREEPVPSSGAPGSVR